MFMKIYEAKRSICLKKDMMKKYCIIYQMTI